MSSHDGFHGPEGEAEGFDDLLDGGIDERFADWVDGRLSEDQEAELEAELVADDELRRRADEYRETVAMLRSHLPSVEDAPAALAANVMAQLPGQRSRLVPFLASLTAAAAMVILYVVLDRLTEAPPAEERTAASPEADAPADESADPSRVGALELEKAGLRAGESGEERENEPRKAMKTLTKSREGLRQEAVPDLKRPAEAKNDAGLGKAEQPKQPVERLLAKKKPAAAQTDSSKENAPPPGAEKSKTGKREPKKDAARSDGGGSPAPSKSPARRPVRDEKSAGKGRPAEGKPAAPAGRSRNGFGGGRSQKPGARQGEREQKQKAGEADKKGSVNRVQTDPDRMRRGKPADVPDPAAAKPNTGPTGNPVSAATLQDLADEFLRDGVSDSRKGKDVIRRRAVRGGRGGGRGRAAFDGTSVLLLTIPREVSPPATASNAEKGVREQGESADAEKKTSKRARRKAEDRDDAEADKKETQGARRGGAKAGEQAKAGKQANAGRQADAAPFRARSLRDFLGRRSTGNLESETVAAVRLPLERFEKLRVEEKGENLRRSDDDYEYATGDEAYLVSGDPKQMRAFFAQLRRYLDARRVPAPPTTGGPGSPGPVRANKTTTQGVVVRVQSYAEPVRDRGMREGQAKGGKAGADKVAASNAGGKDVEFMLVLRRR